MSHCAGLLPQHSLAPRFVLRSGPDTRSTLVRVSGERSPTAMGGRSWPLPRRGRNEGAVMFGRSTSAARRRGGPYGGIGILLGILAAALVGPSMALAVDVGPGTSDITPPQLVSVAISPSTVNSDSPLDADRTVSV